MKRTARIFGTIYTFVMGLVGIVMGFFSTELAARGFVVDDPTSIKLVIVGCALIALAFYVANKVRHPNV